MTASLVPVMFRRRLAAAATRDRFYLAPHLEPLEEDHPDRLFVSLMCCHARDVLIGLYNRLDSGQDVDAEAVEAVLGMAAQPHLDGIIQEEVTSAPRVMIRTRKKTIVPRSAVQTTYMEALARDDMTVTVELGAPADPTGPRRP